LARASNSAHARKFVLPRLEALLLSRTANTDFAILWGQLQFIAETLGVLNWRSKNGQVGGALGRANHKDEQRRWYAKWREHYDASGRSVRIANADFLHIAWGVYKGKYFVSTDFDTAWFAKALGQTAAQPGQKPAVAKQLPEFLKRINSSERAALLERSELSIPPVGREAYSKKIDGGP